MESLEEVLPDLLLWAAAHGARPRFASKLASETCGDRRDVSARHEGPPRGGQRGAKILHCPSSGMKDTDEVIGTMASCPDRMVVSSRTRPMSRH